MGNLKINTSLISIIEGKKSPRTFFKMPSNINRIIIHEVPYYPNLIPDSVKNDWAEGKYRQVGHYIIGVDGTVVNTIPDNELCYHTETRTNPYNNNSFKDYNVDSISIFMICDKADGNLSDESLNSLKELCTYLRDKYNIEEVITGFEANGIPEPRFFNDPSHREFLNFISNQESLYG